MSAFLTAAWPWEAGGVSAAPPHPLRPARCRCRERVGVGLGCGRPARGKRAAKTRTALPAFLRKDPFAFLLHFAACRAETLLRDDYRPMRSLMVDRYGERRALTSRFLSPEPLSCSAGRKNGLREPGLLSALTPGIPGSRPSETPIPITERLRALCTNTETFRNFCFFWNSSFHTSLSGMDASCFSCGFNFRRFSHPRMSDHRNQMEIPHMTAQRI